MASAPSRLSSMTRTRSPSCGIFVALRTCDERAACGYAEAI
jgi:hypothetical protein